MDRDNALEKHLLSRSYSSESNVEELLASRYSLKGEQKYFLLLVPTAGQTEAPQRKEALANLEVSGNNGKLTQEAKQNTRRRLRVYIKTTLANQKKLVKRIQAYNRLNTKAIEANRKEKKPFPTLKMIDHYKIPKFEEFTQLNALWQSYMQELLFPNGNVASSATILQRLSTADFNGCLLTVISSKNQNVVGIRGVVAWDTQHSFILCVPRNQDSKEWNETSNSFSPTEQVGGFKIIAKKGSLFGFDVVLPGENDESIGFTIVGSRFEIRPVDRSGRKFKNHKVDDII